MEQIGARSALSLWKQMRLALHFDHERAKEGAAKDTP